MADGEGSRVGSRAQMDAVDDEGAGEDNATMVMDHNLNRTESVVPVACTDHRMRLRIAVRHREV